MPFQRDILLSSWPSTNYGGSGLIPNLKNSMNIEQSEVPKHNIRDLNKVIVHIFADFKICYIQFIYIMRKLFPYAVTLNGQIWHDNNILFHIETMP